MADAYDLVGKQLGDYELEEKLTSGGMAHIYLGRDIKLDRIAAVKVLTPDISQSDKTLTARFEREARAIAKLEHDSIVPIYQFGIYDGMYFLAMRYIKGRDLAQELNDLRGRDTRMPIQRALNILGQIAAALDYAHQKGIVHRDVKPSNILINEADDKAVLTDFGLVLWEDVDKTLGTAFGTPRYISPEQATDSQSAVPQSDVYSLGVIVYEILTGTHLFTGATPMEVALAHISEKPTPPRLVNPNIPAQAEAEVLRALAKTPEERHQSANAFISALKDIYADDQQAQAGTPGDSWQDPDETAEDSSPSILRNWVTAPGRPEKMPDVTTHPDFIRPDIRPNAQKQANRRLLPLVGVVVLALGAVLVALLGAAPGNGNAASPTSVNEDATSENDPTTLAIRRVPLLLTYDQDFFIFANTSETATLNLGTIRLVGQSSPNDIFDFADQAGALGSELAPGRCLLIQRGGVNDDMPEDWACEPVRETVMSGDALFWRADDSDDEAFTVEADDETLTTCATVGRAVGRLQTVECQFPDD